MRRFTIGYANTVFYTVLTWLCDLSALCCHRSSDFRRNFIPSNFSENSTLCVTRHFFGEWSLFDLFSKIGYLTELCFDPSRIPASDIVPNGKSIFFFFSFWYRLLICNKASFFLLLTVTSKILLFARNKLFSTKPSKFLRVKLVVKQALCWYYVLKSQILFKALIVSLNHFDTDCRLFGLIIITTDLFHSISPWSTSGFDPRSRLCFGIRSV